jgi:phosphoglucosamine mutase
VANNRLFGTDGVRGTAGKAPLDPPTVRRLGAALVRALPHGTEAPQFLVGRDTRESGSWIEAELAHGACGEGASVTSAGVVPTPAVAFLTRTGTYDVGVVISASHNPYEDNGIKVFSGKGEKFTEEVERQVEAIMADGSWSAHAGEAGPVPRADLVDAYLDHLRVVFPEASKIERFPIVLDCANGATTTVGPELFNSLGFETIVMGNRPDGRNINLGCGSTHPEQLAQLVVARGCAMGVAFDGDGDRAIFVDHRGQIVDGDAVLLMCGHQLQREGRLRGDAIVATVMSNIGLELALKPLGIDLVRTSVGDKYVMEEML